MVSTKDFFRLSHILMNNEARRQLTPPTTEVGGEAFKIFDIATAQEYLEALNCSAVPFDKSLYALAKTFVDVVAK